MIMKENQNMMMSQGMNWMSRKKPVWEVEVVEDDTMVVDEHQDSSEDSASDSWLEYKCEQQSSGESEDSENLNDELEKKDKKYSTPKIIDVKDSEVKVDEVKDTTDDLKETKDTVELCIKDSTLTHEF